MQKFWALAVFSGLVDTAGLPAPYSWPASLSQALQQPAALQGRP